MSGLRSGEVAAAAGVNPQTLRYYERRGLIAEPGRTPGGHRQYAAGMVTELRMIKAAQRLGFTLDDIADLLDAGRHRPGRGAGPHRPGADADPNRTSHGAGRPRPGRGAGLPARAQNKLAEVEAKIADLQVIAATLRAAVDAGCDDLVTCAGEPRCPIPFDGRP